MTGKVIGIVGASGSGKTTLMAALIPWFVAQGLSVVTVKRTHHDIDLDQPGKDSHRHRMAGAKTVALVGPKRVITTREGAFDLDAALAGLGAFDLAFAEGFLEASIPKIEVHRPSLGKPLRAVGDPWLKAIASDQVLQGPSVPCLPLSDVVAIARFVERL